MRLSCLGRHEDKRSDITSEVHDGTKTVIAQTPVWTTFDVVTMSHRQNITNITVLLKYRISFVLEYKNILLFKTHQFIFSHN